MSASLRIRLFGEFSICRDGATISGLGSARLQSLLAYLLLNRESNLSRQQLAFLFWPETTDGQAQTNLRQLLHTLRHRFPAIGDYLEIDERTVSWHTDAPIWLDVAEFESSLAAASAHTGSAKLRMLSEAIAIYHGALVPDCYDNWILIPRERLEERYLRALEQCVLLCEERREYLQAIEWARKLLSADPLHEATYRRLMRLHALNSDRVAAVRIFHTCAAALEQELGVAPSAATRELYERLVNAGDGTPAVSRDARIALVGRQREWEALLSAWRTAKRGEVRCVLLSGEAGIGKTRLIEEMLVWANQQGIASAQARAYAAGRDLAFAAIVECLRSDSVAPLVRRFDAVWRSELVRLLPELSTEDPQLPHPELLTERWQRQRLFEAMCRVFISGSRPFILGLDDMQWYAVETLEWLSFLVRFQPHARLLVIGAYRDDEIDVNHPLSRFLMDLRDGGFVSEVPLGTLSVEETHTLASQLSPSRLDDEASLALYRFTQGNPLFVVETVRANLTTGHPVPPAPNQALPSVPSRVHAVIQTRLSKLSPAAHDLAALAATIGRSFTFEVLGHAARQSEEVLLHSLDELWRRRIVVERGATDYDFSHDRIRDVAYAELSPIVRRRLHRQVADALVRIQGPGDDTASALIAGHFQQSGDLRQAVVYYQAAADAALRLFAYRDGIALLESALALVHELPTDDEMLPLELELQMKLSAAWASITSFLGTEAETAYLRALELCERTGHRVHHFTVLWGLHEIALYRAEYQESLLLGKQCLDIARDLNDPGLLLEGQHAVWGPYFFQGDYAHAFEHMQIGLAMYDRELHESLSVHYGIHDTASCALYEGALALWNMGFLDQAREREARSIALAQQLTLPANVADAYSYAALFYHLLRDPARTEQFAEPALHISEEKCYPFTTILSAVPLGWSLAMQGKMAEGLTLAAKGLKDANDTEMRLHYSQLAVMVAEILIAARRYGEAVELLNDAIERFEKYRDLLCAPDLWRLKASVLAATNKPDDEVLDCLEQALAMGQELDARVPALRAATCLAQSQRRRGPTEKAHTQLRTLYAWFSEGHDTPDLLVAKAALDRFPTIDPLLTTAVNPAYTGECHRATP